jgi:hypothetical protein
VVHVKPSTNFVPPLIVSVAPALGFWQVVWVDWFGGWAEQVVVLVSYIVLVITYSSWKCVSEEVLP